MAESAGNSATGLQLHTNILLALLVGATAGILANIYLGGASPTVVWLNTYIAGPVGQVFLRLLFMIVMPLVFSSIALGVAGLGDLRKVGRVGGKALGFFIVSTVLSATLGILLVLAIRPGQRVSPEVQTRLLQTYAGDAGAKVEAAAQS